MDLSIKNTAGMAFDGKNVNEVLRINRIIKQVVMALHKLASLACWLRALRAHLIGDFG